MTFDECVVIESCIVFFSFVTDFKIYAVQRVIIKITTRSLIYISMIEENLREE